MDWLHLLAGSVAPAHADLLKNLSIKFRPPFVLEIHHCPAPEASDRLYRLSHARWDLFRVCRRWARSVNKIHIYTDDSIHPIAVLCKSESLDLIKVKRMEFEDLTRENYRPVLRQARQLNTEELLKWVRYNSKPTALTCNEDGSRTMISHSYADWCDRSWLDFMHESGQANLGRWVQGETKRMLDTLDREDDKIITSFDYRARLWNKPDNSHIWVADVAEIDLGGRSHRLLIFHERLPDNLVSV